MKNNDFWKFVLVIAIICWSLYEIYPPTSQDLVQQFETRARVPKDDTAFKDILARLASLQKTAPGREFANLQQAIGTNDIRKYFSFTGASNELSPTTFILNWLQRDASGKIKLGLDLQGGTSYLVSMDTTKLETVDTTTNAAGQVTTVTNLPDVSGALSQAVDVLRKRIDQFGVAEPTFQVQGSDSILIQLPGLSEADKASALAQITNAAYLEFRMVKEDSQQIIENHLPIPPGYELLKHIEPQPNNQPPMIEQYVVTKKAENGLAGDIVKNALVVRGNLGEPQIDFTLNDTGAKEFAEVTRNNIGRQLAIVLDGHLESAPTIQSAIEAGSGQITGKYTVDEAQQLANVLQNPLRAPLRVDSSYDVDPTLGKDSIRSGIHASIAAVIFVSAFMLVYYWIAGLTANIALVTNIIIIFGVMCSIGATFTLPGIAGMVLTIGMAVDANVLIYERVREELSKGKSLRGAIVAGYARAFGTIFDSHVTTLISSVILIFMGTGEIKGFGVTLTIGVAASLFTALVVTRLIFNFLLDRNWLKSLPMLHIIRSARVNFMKAATPLFVITWAFVILSIGYGAFGRGEKLFGVDFRGGNSTTFSFQQRVGEDQIRSAVAAIGQNDAQIQYQKGLGGGTETLRVTTASGSAQQVAQTMEQQFPQAHFKVFSEQHVSGSVGADVRNSALIACLLALFGILVYVAFRYEFSFAVGAILGVVHDVLLAIGCYCIANAVSGRQFNATVVAALLTIIGFSLNDKVVIFDRIRENLRLGARGSFREIINQALNQTLSRTIITSGTVFLATLALVIFGGGAINDFAFTFLVGIITGTYSSIYIASVLVLWWHKGQAPDIGASQVALQGSAAAKV